ncbi:uncharacterized protein LOC108940229 [Scleropages formosus]|uniref:uncharacterized protein LOC108940229 n=1 Tax=Scleropages formosus TaxID=113540 RepID=UPI0008790364|nr:uncharacterized protein LOC108940229 [Scleropages formosus]
MALTGRKRKSSEKEEQHPLEDNWELHSGELHRFFECEQAVNVPTGTLAAKAVGDVDVPSMEPASTLAHCGTEFDIKDRRDESTGEAQRNDSAGSLPRTSVECGFTEASGGQGAPESQKCSILTELQIRGNLLGTNLPGSVHGSEEPEIKSTVVPGGAGGQHSDQLMHEEEKGPGSCGENILGVMQGVQESAPTKVRLRRRMGAWDFRDRERRNHCESQLMGRCLRKGENNGEGERPQVEEESNEEDRKDEGSANSDSDKGVTTRSSGPLVSEVFVHRAFLSDGHGKLNPADDCERRSTAVTSAPDESLGSDPKKEGPSRPGASATHTVRESKCLSTESFSQVIDSTPLAPPFVQTTSEGQENPCEMEGFLFKERANDEEEEILLRDEPQKSMRLEAMNYTVMEEDKVLGFTVPQSDTQHRSLCDTLPQENAPSSAQPGVLPVVTAGCGALGNTSKDAVQLLSVKPCSAADFPGCTELEEETRAGANSHTLHKLNDGEARCLGAVPAWELSANIGTNLLCDNPLAGDCRASLSVEDIGELEEYRGNTCGADLVTGTRKPPATEPIPPKIALEVGGPFPPSCAAVKVDAHVAQVNCQTETRMNSDPASLKGTTICLIQQTDSEDKTAPPHSVDAPTLRDLEAACLASSGGPAVTSVSPPASVEDPLSWKNLVQNLSTEVRDESLSPVDGGSLDTCLSSAASRSSMPNSPPACTVPTVLDPEVSFSLFSLSDSQIDNLMLSQMDDQAPYPTEEEEDATELMCGLIKELSSLNQTVMAAHRELESLRRGNKTSRPPITWSSCPPKH